MNLQILGLNEVEQETDNDTDRWWQGGYWLLLGYRPLQNKFFAGLIAGQSQVCEVFWSDC